MIEVNHDSSSLVTVMNKCFTTPKVLKAKKKPINVKGSVFCGSYISTCVCMCEEREGEKEWPQKSYQLMSWQDLISQRLFHSHCSISCMLPPPTPFFQLNTRHRSALLRKTGLRKSLLLSSSNFHSMSLSFLARNVITLASNLLAFCLPLKFNLCSRHESLS